MVLLELRRISKWFGAVQALREVTLSVEAGEVLAVVGDNGAGKSTLIKIISGVHQPDAGEIWLEGRRTVIPSPQAAKRMGIETLYQDLALFEPADVVANFFAGREWVRSFLGGLIQILDESRMRAYARRTLDRLGITLPGIDHQIRLLSGGQRQSVAIGRAIAFGSRLVLMDEPTAALGAVESAKVLGLVRSLRTEGVSFVVISHNLQHVFGVADRIAVLRHGTLQGVLRPAETTSAAVVQMMVGDGDRDRCP